MTRTAALRAAVVFAVLTFLFGAFGVSAYAPAAEVLFLISASIGAVLLAFGLAVPRHAAIPVRVRSRASHRPRR